MNQGESPWHDVNVGVQNEVQTLMAEQFEAICINSCNLKMSKTTLNDISQNQ